MKLFNPSKEQLESYLNGATMILVKINDYDQNRIDKGYSIGDSFPLEKGEEFFIQEETTSDDNWTKSSENKEYKLKDICLNIKIKRVLDITLEECNKITTYSEGHKLVPMIDNIKNNPFVFLLTIKGIK